MFRRGGEEPKEEWNDSKRGTTFNQEQVTPGSKTGTLNAKDTETQEACSCIGKILSTVEEGKTSSEFSSSIKPRSR